MLVIKRKNLVIGLLVVLLVITGYLNFIYNQNSMPAVNSQETAGDDGTADGEIFVTDLQPSEGLVSNQVGNNEDTVQVSASSFFRDYRFERENNRKSEIQYINTIVDHPKSDAEIIKEAQLQLLEITSNMEKEMAIETLIKAKGFKDVVVVIHRNNVSVIVDKPELAPDEVAQILETVRKQSGEKPENIKIIPKI